MGFFNQQPIKKVKVLGIRTAEETKIFHNVNSAQYSLLILDEDGSRGLVECEAKELIKKYIDYIDID